MLVGICFLVSLSDLVALNIGSDSPKARQVLWQSSFLNANIRLITLSTFATQKSLVQ
jgi:hypothetical protein